MRRIRIKSGGHINILGIGEAAIPGEMNFTEKEWKLAQRLIGAQVDPECKKGFWNTLVEKKKDVSYSLFEDFPEEPECKETPREHSVRKATEVLEMLRGKRTVETSET